MTNETEGPQENASPANTSQCASTTSLSSASGGSPGLPAGAQVADVTAAPSSNNRSAATEQPHTSNGRNFEQCTALANLDDYLPKYGFKVNFDYSFPKKWSPYAVPPVNMLVELVPFFFRYMKHFVSSAFKSKKPFIDGLRLITSKNMYGVPLGGIGCGTIGRGFRGEFCRFQVTPGTVDFNTAVADQFILTVRSEQGETLLQKVLSPVSRPRGRKLLAWDWECSAAVSGRYCGLYPRSWTVYDVPGLQLRLMLRQISPVVPGEYKDSSLPVGVFVWTVENNSSRALSVSICSTFKNGTGGSDDAKGACWSELSCGDTNAVLLHHQYRGADLTYCLAARQQAGVETTACLGFDPNGTGQALWQSLASTGQLSDNFCSKDKPPKPSPVSELGMALNCQVQVAAGERRSFEQALVWDMPLIHFKSRQMQYRRRYSRWFSGDGAAVRIAEHAFKQYRHWEDSLDAWQNTILDDPKLPAWFKSALLNQLYYVADGGTVWVDVPDEEAASFPKDDPRLEYGRFAYLESHEYRMFNTYDVHFYASWALAMLWPELQRSLQYDMAMYTRKEDHTDTRFLFSGVKGVLKTANTLPHDIGNPEDEPFLKINAYIAHDVNDWKDLNLKFVLQVYRDYKLFGNDMKYLSDMWATCEVVMATSAKFDTDGDGLIENGGYADQTFDTWIMHGPSAYCCSLWLASISAMEEMAGALQKEEHRAKYSQLLIKAQASFEEKLWNGSYYNFDSSKHRRHETIMSDQLVGHWYLSLAGHQKEVFKPDHVRKALNTLYDYNVLKFCGGKMGAVNGIMPDGGVDNGILQSYEMWPGCAFALAATFIHEGMTEEGFRTAEGIYNTTYYDVGLGFDMPEALYEDGHYRAVGYMRPLSIWSMYQAYKLSQSKK